MGRFIIKLGSFYLMWSTVVDCPVSFGMTRDEFIEFYGELRGNEGLELLNARLERTDAYGISSLDGTTRDDLIVGNRAGPNETELTLTEIQDAYCLGKRIKGNWSPRDLVLVEC